MAKMIVKLDNWVNTLQFQDFTSKDYDLFMGICGLAKNKGEDLLVIGFDDLKKLTNYARHNESDFIRNLRRMNKKLQQIRGTMEDEKKIVDFVLFPTFTTNKKEKNLEIRVNKDFLFVLNEFRQYTKFELSEFVSLKKKYSKALYRLLKQYRTTGYMYASIDEFRLKMDIKPGYINENIMIHVIKPAIQEITSIGAIEGLKCVAKRGNTQGSPIKGYEFTFTPEKILPNPEKIKEAAGSTGADQDQYLTTSSRKKPGFGDMIEHDDWDFAELEKLASQPIHRDGDQ